MSKTSALLLSILVLSLLAVGCGLGPSPQKPPAAPVPQQVAPAAESVEIAVAVQSAMQSFLSNDFTGAQKNMLLLPAEQNDLKTQRMFTDFSLHLNKRLALDAKDAGLKSALPSLSVANVRTSQTPGSSLADVSIRAAEGLEPLTLTVKATRSSGVWLVDFAPFMLALVDALGEE